MNNILVIFSVVVFAITYTSADAELRPNITAWPIDSKDELMQRFNQINAYIPPDDGYSNWGDLFYQKRQNGDRLLSRDIVTYPVQATEQFVLYSVPISNVVTSVRLINFGRQRGYGTEINVYPNYVEAYYYVPALYDPRVMIEVYGY